MHRLMRLSARLLLLLHLLRHVHEFKKEITSVELKAVSDKIPLEPKQRMWLDEIYSLRKQEERFERKEIGTIDVSTSSCTD